MRPGPHGFSVIIVALVIGATALVASTLIVWQLNVRAAVHRHVEAREFRQEQRRLQTAALALVRQALATNQRALFSGVTRDTLNPLLSSDPRFPNHPAGGATTPGFTLLTLDPPAPPACFSLAPAFSVPGGGSPVDGLRQTIHDAVFSYTLARRYQPADDPARLAAQTGAFHLRLREVPATQFGLIAFEELDLDSGLQFHGPSLILGPVVQTSSPIDLWITPRLVNLTQIGVSDRVWMAPALSASVMTQPGTLCDPSAAGGAQNLAVRGQALNFDGRSLSSGDAPVPAGISVATYRGVPRVVVDLKALPQWNLLIDSGAPGDPANQISAYHIHCANPLARDRGIVILGTDAARAADQITTDGALILAGAHTGGPLLCGSTFGGAYFDNTGDVSWNAYLVLPAPSPWLSATTAAAAPARARGLVLASGAANLSLSEQAFDTITLKLTPTSGVFTAALGSVSLTQNLAWVESDGSTLRLGVYTPAGNLYSGSVPRGAGEVDLTLSRTQSSLKLSYPGGVLYWNLPAGRPRIETTIVRWSGGLNAVEVWSSGGGTTLGSASTGTISLRGLLTLGKVSAFGAASFVFTPAPGGDPVETIAPRLLLLQP
ncbi:MAG: hypothetical protein PHE83_17185 [Opitutaceae bacterium]|nr:hypothetical protein [Opitutaceae bacterium]